MILEQKFPVSASSFYWGKLYLPDDYSTTNEQHPLIVFGHGTGERGGTKDNLAMLNNTGPWKFITGGDKMEFTNPVDKKPYKFIVLSLQDPDWSPSASEIGYCLINHIFTNYRINRNCVVTTGLSAGGDSTLRCITTPGIMELFSSAVPMSPASSGNTNNVAATAAMKIKVWGFHGNRDNVTPLQNILAFDAKLNAVAPGTCRTHVYNGDHSSWEQFYNPAYKSAQWGGSMNIYEFMLASMKGSAWTPPPPPSTTVVADFDVTDGVVIPNTSFTADASLSKNVRDDWQGYQWGLKPLKGGSWDARPKGGSYGGPVKEIIGLTDGLYELALTVTDNFGKTNTRTINFSVALGAPVPIPDPEPIPKVLAASVYTTKGMVNVFEDGSTEVK
jgi:hypothetical protein